MREKITGTIRKAILVKEALLTDSDLLDKTEEAIRIISEALKGRRRVLFCGNGGSAADAQHLAAELSGKFYLDRTALNAEAINLNIPFLTAVSNDYDYSYSFARYLEGAAAPGDVLLLLSTSGTSPNIVRAARYASAAGIRTIALTGATGGDLLSLADITLRIPSADTPRIQEAHMLLGHVICEEVEQRIFGKNDG
ncbi:MAG: SIS domain-containing protein [Prolixibacteraceae bacterium]|jgi:D-sedoheptulose 7-phosphate isomerase|nr:SIS domain-containing protein [Prolixibacteraceae bacterium]MDI9564856.1 SIS domain-containing protein [Bacteroidota bacterium]NLT00847.1 SIS domain-containing protein [Bacteroidales bacterium]OQB79441.1 MAG: Phosphoheptose isomerase [Bacteroidetes bacterium ADurb.Bin123]HNU77687.1 SIS domain-containing protein [Prolixibacteraceae bacterium]